MCGDNDTRDEAAKEAARKEMAMLATRFNAFDTIAVALRGFIIAIVAGAATIAFRSEAYVPLFAGEFLLIPLLFTEARLRRYFVAASNRFKFLANDRFGAGYKLKPDQQFDHMREMGWHPAGGDNGIRRLWHKEIIAYYGTATAVLLGAGFYIYANQKGPDGPFPAIQSNWKSPFKID